MFLIIQILFYFNFILLINCQSDQSIENSRVNDLIDTIFIKENYEINEKTCKCVPYHMCKTTSEKNTNGVGIIDPR